ncbi:MAG: DUF2764 family protein [Victivallales bacterium]|nr:DUF2764 family protein [Victivallales bacterium]
MGVDLFYFISSLPTLGLDGQCPLTATQFLQQCRELLGDDIADRLERIRLVPDNTSPVDDTVAQWYSFETYLRNTLSELRRSRLKLPPQDTGRQSKEQFYLYRKQIEEAMALTSTVARENKLDAMRFAYLGELESAHYFNLPLLELYLLKLLIIDKRSGRKLPEGRATFDRMLEAGFAQAGEKRIGDEL